ncbi:MAG: M48 family metalloprotease [Bacteroidota bacterium]
MSPIRTPSYPLRLVVALLFAAQTVAMSGCATNPVTGRKQISLVSEGKELQMGAEADPAVISEYGLYDDQEIQRYVDGVGQRLGKVSHLPTLTWHFRVLDSPVVNAFAIPGGYIYITRGILAYMSSEAQLAGVLGHEIGHVTARHSAQQITKQEIAGIGLLASAVFVSAFRPYSGIAQQGLGLLFLKYSRDNETQADELGVGYATKAGYDPREIPATYVTLKRIGERSASSLPSFLSTHPDPGDREIRTTQLANAAASSAHRPLEIDAPQYRAHIDGLTYGDDPRAGYFVGNRFYHPQLKFQMIFPQGWKTQNQPSQVVAASPSGAAMQLTLVKTDDTSLSPSDYVASLQKKGEVVQANGHSENFRDYPAWVGTVTAQTDQGNKDFQAVWVRIQPGQFLQILGQGNSESAADQIFASARTIAALTDRDRLNVTPDRVVVTPAPRSAPFSDLWASMGGGAISLEEGAILNSTRAGTVIERGTPIKTVKKGNHPSSS